MKRIIFSFCACLLAYSSFSQDPRVIPLKGNNPSEFIPRNYTILDKLNPDINEDGWDDVILVLDDTTVQSESDSLSRIIVILLSTSSDTIPTDFRLSAIALHAIDCKTCGGVSGDPFMGVEYRSKNKSIFISHWGGSRWGWSSEYQFRYKDGDWYLIGSVLSDYDKLGMCTKLNDNISTTTSTNYITGDVVETVIDEKCVKTIKNKKEAKKPLIRLSDFRIHP